MLKRFMKPKRFSNILMLLTVCILLCSQFLLLNVKAQNESGPYSILFDEAHDQYYTYTNGTFTSALDYLNQTADFVVYLNTNPLDNITQLQSYDLIIIGNPGPAGNFSSLEIQALKNYTLLGGNLMLLCNYNDVNNPLFDENITGHADYLNNLTQVLNIPVSFTYYDLYDESHIPIGPRWYVELGSQNFQFGHPIKWKLSTIIIHTSGLNMTATEGAVGTGYSDSYLNNRTSGTLSETPWLYATQQESYRIILCGSIVMFSDLNVTNTGTTSYKGVAWIDSVDNLRLWANLIQWALITETPEVFTAYIIIVSVIAVIGIALFLYYSYFTTPKSSTYEMETEKLSDERAFVLKEARTRAAEGQNSAAAQLYKKASRLSNKLGDYKSEKLYNRKHRELLAKTKKG